MIKVTVENCIEFSKPYREFFLYYFMMNELITNFCNNSNQKVFEYVFDGDGERLWRHFKLDCDSRFDKFKTYLTQNQADILFVSLKINGDSLYSL